MKIYECVEMFGKNTLGSSELNVRRAKRKKKKQSIMRINPAKRMVSCHHLRVQNGGLIYRGRSVILSFSNE